MKRLILGVVGVGIFLASDLQARATPLAPGGSASSLSLYSLPPAPALGYSDGGGFFGFDVDGSFTHVVHRTWIERGYGANPFVNGTLAKQPDALTFFYQIQVKGYDPAGDLMVSVGSFSTDVGYTLSPGGLPGAVAGGVAPTGAIRAPGLPGVPPDVIDFHFASGVPPDGSYSAILIVNTNAIFFRGGLIFVDGINEINDFSPGDAIGYDGSLEPTTQTPEPATLTLLGIGIAGMAGYGWRGRKKSLPGSPMPRPDGP